MHDVEQDPHIKRLRWRKIEPDAGFLQKETLGPILKCPLFLSLATSSSSIPVDNSTRNTSKFVIQDKLLLDLLTSNVAASTASIVCCTCL